MIPTRPATDDDLRRDIEGRAFPVCVSFFYDLSQIRFVERGFRRPRKVRGEWVVSKRGERPLLVRTDTNSDFPDFVASAGEVPTFP